jgi:hypothetical protein
MYERLQLEFNYTIRNFSICAPELQVADLSIEIRTHTNVRKYVKFGFAKKPKMSSLHRLYTSNTVILVFLGGEKEGEVSPCVMPHYCLVVVMRYTGKVPYQGH